VLFPSFLLLTVGVDDVDIVVEVRLNLLHLLFDDLTNAFVFLG